MHTRPASNGRTHPRTTKRILLFYVYWLTLAYQPTLACARRIYLTVWWDQVRTSALTRQGKEQGKGDKRKFHDEEKKNRQIDT